MQTNVASMSLAEAAWPAREGNKLLRSAVLVVAGVAFMTLCAKIQVPMWPVPMTMQTFGALVIGAAYGWPLGAVTVLGYLAAGFFGLPVFSGAAVPGPAYFLGTTAGYLYGFVAAAGIVGWLCERRFWDRSPVTAGLAMLIGSAVIYVFGLAWLYTVLVAIRGVAGWDMLRVLNAGMIPFLVGDLVKLLLAAALLPIAWNVVRRFRD